MSTLDLAAIATDKDLVQRHRLVARIMPNETDRDAARQLALDDVEASLLRRNPPVRASNLSSPVELRNAVVFRALWHCFGQAVTQEGDVNWVMMREFGKQFDAEMSRTFSVGTGGIQSPPRMITVSRG